MKTRRLFNSKNWWNYRKEEKEEKKERKEKRDPVNEFLQWYFSWQGV